jgi:sporulation protein YlmC with PRC-barrel domain
MAKAAPNHTLITASRVTGTPVFDRDGERIGRIEDLSIDKHSGQVCYALLDFGGFLGVGDHLLPLPWSQLQYDAQKQGFIVGLDKAELEQAPHYGKLELEAFGGGEPPPPAAFI